MLNKCDVTESCPAMVRRELPGSKNIYEISAKDPESATEALSRFVEVLSRAR
jgi:hypothetical protein